MQTLLERLRAARYIQKNAGKIAPPEQEKPTAQQSEHASALTWDTLFKALFPHIALHWGYDETDKAEVWREGSKPENIEQMVRSWMIECITYNIPINSQLRSICFQEFESSPSTATQAIISTPTITGPDAQDAKDETVGSDPEQPRRRPSLAIARRNASLAKRLAS